MLAPFGEFQTPSDGAIEIAGHRAGVQWFQGAESGRRQIPGDAAHAQTVGAVGRDRDIDHRIAEAGVIDITGADRRVGRQVDDAVMVVGEHQLALRTEHAVRRLAADIAGFEGHLGARDIGAGGGENALHAGPRVGRAADHLQCLLARVDQAQAQAVGVWVRLRLDHVGDGEIGERGGAILDTFQFQAQHG